MVAFAEYGKMRDALNATGRPIYFSLCGWNNWYQSKLRALVVVFFSSPNLLFGPAGTPRKVRLADGSTLMHTGHSLLTAHGFG